jgi:nucleoid DNA-binding protein
MKAIRTDANCLTTRDLYAAVAEAMGVEYAQGRDTTVLVLDLIAQALAQGAEVALTNFGTFKVGTFSANYAIPQPGENAERTTIKGVRFAAGAGLNAAVRRQDANYTTRKADRGQL